MNYILTALFISFMAAAHPEGIAHARAKLGTIALEEQRYVDAVQFFENSLANLRHAAAMRLIHPISAPPGAKDKP